MDERTNSSDRNEKGYDDGKVNSRTNTEMSDADAVCYSACIVNLSNQSRKDID